MVIFGCILCNCNTASINKHLFNHWGESLYFMHQQEKKRGRGQGPYGRVLSNHNDRKSSCFGVLEILPRKLV